MKTTAKDRQSIIDIAVQTSGDVMAAAEVAIGNDVSITDDLAVGEVLATAEVVDKNVVSRYAEKGIVPTTAIDEADADNAPFGGIGYMSVELDFIVS